MPLYEVKRQYAFALTDIGYILKDRVSNALPYLKKATQSTDQELAELANNAITAIST